MLTVKIDDRDLVKALKGIEAFSSRRIASVVATAISRSTVAARDEVRKELDRVIDSPTEFTRRGLFIRTANPQRLEGRIWFGSEDRPSHRYLRFQIEGGERTQKRFEKALQATGVLAAGMFTVPGPAARRDTNGNVDRGQIQQMLSQLGTEHTAGYSRTLRRREGENDQQWANRRRRAFGRSGGQYFAVPRQRGKLRPGIYLAEGRDFGRAGYGRSGGISLVFAFVSTVKYTAKFRFYEVAERVVAERMPVELQRAAEESAARLMARGVA